MLIIHLSDIHFRKSEIATQLDPNVHLRNVLLTDAKMMCDRLGRSPDCIIVSGDIAFAGDPDEYAFAKKWLEKLCAACGSTLAKVFVIPGNHDVVRSVVSRNVISSLHSTIKQTPDMALDAVMTGLLVDTESARLLYEGIVPYNTFAGEFLCDLSPPNRTIAIRELTLNDGSTLRISGLNSTFVSSSADVVGSLYVDPSYRSLTQEAGVTHLVLCHHPFNWIRQGSALRDHLNDVAQIQLFGHEHTNRIELARDWVKVFASAAHPDRTEAGWEPGYNLIELEVDNTAAERKLLVKAHVRIWQSAPGQFRPKFDKQADVFTQSIVLAPWQRQLLQQADKPEDPSGSAMPVGRPSAVPDNDVPINSDPLSSLHELSVKFFKLTLSQKLLVAGKLNLFEDSDINKPDFEKFRNVLLRAKDRNRIAELEEEIQTVLADGTTGLGGGN